MTNKQINAAIAEACGWKTKNNHWITPNGTPVYTIDLPDYCTDLNAMHEAERTIYNKHNNLWTAYYYAVGAGPFSLHVTARRKAEAFLKALGKWEEAK